MTEVSSLSSSLPTGFEFSAGGIVVKKNKILVIKTEKYGPKTVYTFPKGKLKKFEKLTQGALREVREETGCVCKIKDELFANGYLFIRENNLIIKKVFWFKMEVVDRCEKSSTDSYPVRWIPKDRLIEKLHFKTDKHLVRKTVS
ncbi:MAG: NUDIX domain-containing protein [Elusimicrobiota bacterium]